MDDVRKRLKPGGLFVMYNYFRQGWIVSRLQNSIRASFGSEALVLNLPSRDRLDPDQSLGGDFTVLIAGDNRGIRDAFAQEAEYWLQIGPPLDSKTPNGFRSPLPHERAAWRARPELDRAETGWHQFRLTRVNAGNESARLATDDWPMLYLREPMIPGLNIRGALIMAIIAVVLLAPFLKRPAGALVQATDSAGALLQMFFLGAGFMLVETKAVVHMALLFGGTWIVNSVVIFAVFVMILAANLFVLLVKPSQLWPYYAALMVSLIVSALVPMEYFLGMERAAQIAGSSALAFTPILFAGVIFAVSFARVAEADRAFGANIAGAMFGGLAEYSSMLLGFQYLLFVAAGLYVLSIAVQSYKVTVHS